MALVRSIFRTGAAVSSLAERLPLRMPMAMASSRGRRRGGSKGPAISARWNEDLFEQKSTQVFNLHMRHYERKYIAGYPTVVFLHGNPTSSYLWRNVMVHLAKLRCRMLAPDLVGMGASGKPLDQDFQYRFVQHAEFLDNFLRLQGVTKCNDVILVVHDWGSALGFHWARRHPECVKAIIHMESLVHAPIPWTAFPEESRKIFQLLRSDAGEELVYKKNIFVERLLPGSIMRKLHAEEMQMYLRPFVMNEPHLRRPTLTWPREIPIEGEGPTDVEEIVKSYSAWLAETGIPKLFVAAEPGFFTPGCLKAMKHWKNQKVVSVPGLHFLQEDSPHEIGEHIYEFLRDTVCVPEAKL